MKPSFLDCAGLHLFHMTVMTSDSDSDSSLVPMGGAEPLFGNERQRGSSSSFLRV